MKEIIIDTDFVFGSNAEDYFKFPIANPVRISFWLTEDSMSTFSERYAIEGYCGRSFYKFNFENIGETF